MEISIERCENSPYNYDNVTVRVGNTPILTLVTNNGLIASKWLKNVQNSYNSRLPNMVVVGLCVDHQLDYTKNDLDDPPYNILQLCVGSQCLLYHFSDEDTYSTITETLHNFFSDSSVLAVGMKMKAVAEKIEREHGVKISNYGDLNRLAVKGLKRDDPDLMKYNLDQLLEEVFDGHMYFERPQVKEEWFEGEKWVLSDELVKYATLEPYLCYRIGVRLLELIDFPEAESVASKKKKKKEEKKARKKKDKEEKKARKKKKEKVREMHELMMMD